MRDAWRAASELPKSRCGWAVEFVPPKLFIRTFNPGEEATTSDLEGQLAISASFSGPRERFNSDSIKLLLGDLVRAYGDVLAQTILQSTFPAVRLRVEYFDLAATTRVKKLQGLVVGVREIDVYEYRFNTDA